MTRHAQSDRDRPKVNCRSRLHRRQRAGWLLMELSVAMALILMMVYALAEVTTRIHDVLASARERTVATEALANAADHLFLVDPDQLDQAMESLRLPEWTRDAIPNAQLTAESVSDADDAGGRVIVVSLKWRDQQIDTAIWRPSGSLASATASADEETR